MPLPSSVPQIDPSPSTNNTPMASPQKSRLSVLFPNLASERYVLFLEQGEMTVEKVLDKVEIENDYDR